MGERKNIYLERYTDDPEERIRLSHMLDCLSACETRLIPTATAFLTEREQILCVQVLEALAKQRMLPAYSFWGGFSEAERRILAFAPDYSEPEAFLQGEESPLACARVKNREAGLSGRPALTHRDYLGALMGAGLRRDAVGDLLVRDDGCDIVLMKTVLPYITESFQKAGRASLETSSIPLAELSVPEPKTREIRDTVASLRLDAVLGAAFSMPRAKAAAAAAAGHVTVSGKLCQKPDAPVREGDALTWRGYGKAELAEVGGLSRKGRITLRIVRYL